MDPTNATRHGLVWDAPGMLPKSDSNRTRRYRRLQSWYRAVQLGVPAGAFMSYDQLGSWLHPDAVAGQRDLNFLHPAAYRHAEQRKDEVQREGGTLETTRLFHNMLSSMPMCFNLFGAMREEHASFLPVFQQLFDARATAITDIVCEWTPADPDARLGDRTAFDAVVLYEATDGPAFCGIETKYTEPFSRKVYAPSNTNRYEEVTRKSGWFAPSAPLEALKGAAANQLWRNTMLAARIDQQKSLGRGQVAVVALADDGGVSKAQGLVAPALSSSHADRLCFITVEDILSATEELSPDLAWWATSFRRRYVDDTLPDITGEGAGRDPLGPMLGRSITDTAAAARHALKR